MDGIRTRARRVDADGRARWVTLAATDDGWQERPWGRPRLVGSPSPAGRTGGERVRHAEVARVHVGGTEHDVRVTVWLQDGSARRYHGGLALLGLAQAALDARA
jgi:hypothetical protein